jgi:hypothetical protein
LGDVNVFYNNSGIFVHFGHNKPKVNRWILKVEPRHRIRIDKPIFESVPWLAGSAASVTLVAIPINSGALAVRPQDSREEIQHRKLVQCLVEYEADPDASEQALSLARYATEVEAGTLTFTKEKTRFSVVMPEVFRVRKIAPAAGEQAVVFSYGSRLEIWRYDEWYRRHQENGGSLVSLIEDASTEIGLDKP